MKTFSIRAVNLVLIVALLIGYNTVLTLRDKDDQIAKLTADLESAKLYKQSVMQSKEDAAVMKMASGKARHRDLAESFR